MFNAFKKLFKRKGYRIRTQSIYDPARRNPEVERKAKNKRQRRAVKSLLDVGARQRGVLMAEFRPGRVPVSRRHDSNNGI